MIKPKNLNQLLSLLLIFVTVPLLLGALALMVAQAQHERQLAQTQLSALARTLVQAVDRELDHGKAQLEVLAASSVIDQRDWQGLHAYGREITRSRPGSLVALVSPEGQQLVNTGVDWGQSLPNLWRLGREHQEALWEGHKLPLSSQNLTREVFEKNQAIYSDLYYGLLIKRPTLALSVPVARSGQVAYALVLSFPPVLIEQMIRESVNAPGLRAVVIDRRGTVVASNEAAFSRMGAAATVMPIPPGSTSGLYQVTSRDGTPLQGAYAVSGVNGFMVRVALPSAGAGGAWSALSTGWMALVVGVLLVSALLVGSLGGRLARMLRELGQAARDGQAPGGPPSGIAEIDLLAQALRAGLQAERERRQELVISTQRQQTELELRKADRQKDEFLATLAHELRNPLAPIRTAVELIRQRQSTDAVVLRAQAVIERQVLHLSRLVDDLLEVSRITMGTIRLRLEPLDLRALVAGVAEAAEAGARAAGVTLSQAPTDGAPVTVSGDTTRLSQCVTNLLNNALKFTPLGGRITLRVAREGHLAVVEVSDNGIGISADNLERIFELFVQANPSGTHGHTGLGIGLALTRKLVALHGGAVHAASAGPGQGSRFRIELPLSSGHTPQAASQAQDEARAAGGVRVLVVDDNRDAADMLGEMLALSGFEILVEYAGEAALRTVEARAPDAVLLDIGLPDTDGYQVCRRIRAMAGLSQPVLIAVTGWGQESDRELAHAAGFDAHLTKPTEPEAVIALLNDKLAARGAGAPAKD